MEIADIPVEDLDLLDRMEVVPSVLTQEVCLQVERSPLVPEAVSLILLKGDEAGSLGWFDAQALADSLVALGAQVFPPQPEPEGEPFSKVLEQALRAQQAEIERLRETLSDMVALAVAHGVGEEP